MRKRIDLAVLRQLRKYERHLEAEWSYDLNREAWRVGDDLDQLRRLLARHGLRPNRSTKPGSGATNG